jgi:hypothetical protein
VNFVVSKNYTNAIFGLQTGRRFDANSDVGRAPHPPAAKKLSPAKYFSSHIGTLSQKASPETASQDER